MKPTAYLINTARGGIIDERALHERWCPASSPAPASTCSSRSRRRPAIRCSRLPNVIMAPHMAGVTREAVDRMSEQTARNILSALDGEPIRQNVINQDCSGR